MIPLPLLRGRVTRARPIRRSFGVNGLLLGWVLVAAGPTTQAAGTCTRSSVAEVSPRVLLVSSCFVAASPLPDTQDRSGGANDGGGAPFATTKAAAVGTTEAAAAGTTEAAAVGTTEAAAVEKAKAGAPAGICDLGARLPLCREVSAGIYRSAQPTTEGFRRAKELGLRTVIVLRETVPTEERKTLADLGLGLVHVPMDGLHMPSMEEVDRALDAMLDPSKRPALVHCKHGEDRTGAVIAAYRVVVDGWAPAAAEKEALDLNFSFGNLKKFLADYKEHRRAK